MLLRYEGHAFDGGEERPIEVIKEGILQPPMYLIKS